MGKIYSATCKNCNKMYNFDVGIGDAYHKSILLDLDSGFNLCNLFKERKRKKELEKLLKSKKYDLKDEYGNKIFICDTCKSLYSRFSFSLIDDKNIEVFKTRFLCHRCRKILRELSDDEIENEFYKCMVCKNKIKFKNIGEWN